MKVIHRLTMGYLDPDAVRRGQRVVLKALDMSLVAKLLQEFGEIDANGQARIDGLPVQFHDGYIVCPWLMPGRIQQTEEFARRLSSETGCLMADFTNRRIVTVEAFSACRVKTPVAEKITDLPHDLQELR